MRVLVLATATDRLGPRLAGGVVGQAFARRGHQVAVVPMAERADQLASALADLSESTACLVPASGRATELAAAVRAQASAGATTVLVDLSADVALDLAASGAAPVVGIDLIGVVSADQLTLPLVGVRGVAARAGFASGEDRAQVLARDAAYAQLAERLQVEPGPGAGAAGGGGLLVLALGGRLASAPQVLAELSGLEHSRPGGAGDGGPGLRRHRCRPGPGGGRLGRIRRRGLHRRGRADGGVRAGTAQLGD